MRLAASPRFLRQFSRKISKAAAPVVFGAIQRIIRIIRIIHEFFHAFAMRGMNANADAGSDSDLMILAQGERLAQAVGNLVGNAGNVFIMADFFQKNDKFNSRRFGKLVK